MSRRNDAAPIIIRRKKVAGGKHHHGGAWKVAYADFVTAMMAFFLMMWLLGATSESQRRGLADYFNPSIPVHRLSSGGDGLLGGSDIETRENLGPDSPRGDPEAEADAIAAESAQMEEAARHLRGLGGENPALDDALRHMMMRVTDEGLVIEIFDLPDSALFHPDTNEPKPVLRIIAGILGEVLGMVGNAMAVEGHTRSYTMVQRDDPHWSLSMARAASMRRLLEEGGVDPSRLARLTGHADRRPAVENAMASRNNRLEVILLRQSREPATGRTASR
ncbi:MAG: OmpA family protein [Pararhodobacter sp.]|nr:OmpA family protein [Pararhodobacter sp.]